ncbi:hypothetical protein JOQ06_012009 [Pogonophryne albipinna]|uniref:Uncharacterized protein n=1 Tax=Pogonophryne albipinna TaxID=1090488 RepID=A0AAD6FQC9_9TELE|nr:hypothetical protein JOQ06_012009 [Pogonophryne albipinna]
MFMPPDEMPRVHVTSSTLNLLTLTLDTYRHKGYVAMPTVAELKGPQVLRVFKDLSRRGQALPVSQHLQVT